MIGTLRCTGVEKSDYLTLSRQGLRLSDFGAAEAVAMSFGQSPRGKEGRQAEESKGCRHCRELRRREMSSVFADTIDIAVLRSTLTSRVAFAPFYDDFPMTVPCTDILRSNSGSARGAILCRLGRCRQAVAAFGKDLCFGWRSEEGVRWTGGAERAHRTPLPEAPDDGERDGRLVPLSVWDRPTCHRSAVAGI